VPSFGVEQERKKVQGTWQSGQNLGLPLHSSCHITCHTGHFNVRSMPEFVVSLVMFHSGTWQYY